LVPAASIGVQFAHRTSDQDAPGNWFAPIRPLNAQHAEELMNVRKWKNYGEQLRIYIVRERIAGYAGKVAGGEGHQFFIPRRIGGQPVSLSTVLEDLTAGQ
jgi:hypothetical protein